MKKILGFLAIAMIAVAMFLTTKSVDQSSEVTLASLTTLNTASAECPPYKAASGKCLSASQVCVFAVTYTDCSP